MASIRRPAKHSRVGAAIKILKGLGWVLEDGINFEPCRINLRLPWAAIRKAVIHGLRHAECQALLKRRPSLYLGITDLYPKAHRRLLNSIRPYEAATLLRIWGGSVLTKSHWHTIDKAIEPSCMCGAENQTLDHLLYWCPLLDPPPLDIQAWALRVPAESIALLCPPSADNSTLRTWKRVCLRAVQVVSGVPTPSPEVDWNGHVVHYDASASFVYCIRCHTMRKISDSKFLPVKPCEGEYAGYTATQGEYVRSHGHVLRLVMFPWRKTAVRLKWCCQKCPLAIWPHLFPPTRACTD